MLLFMISNIVFLDTSFIKALVDVKDDFHTAALTWWKKEENKKIEFITSNFILDESFTVLRSKCSKDIAIEARNVIAESDPSIKIIRVVGNDEVKAWQWFEKDWKGLSFTDCVTFALLQRLHVSKVATFDHHFKKAGFSIFP